MDIQPDSRADGVQLSLEQIRHVHYYRTGEWLSISQIGRAIESAEQTIRCRMSDYAAEYLSEER